MCWQSETTKPKWTKCEVAVGSFVITKFYQLTITIKKPDQRKESKYKDILITKLTIDSER